MLRGCDTSTSHHFFTGVVVTSAGGAGTTTVLRDLAAAGLTTNDQANSDGLKHMQAASVPRWPPRLGRRPLILFLFDDPTAAMVSLARRGWTSSMAHSLEVVRRLPNEFRDAECVVAEREAHIERHHRNQTAPPLLGCPHLASPLPPSSRTAGADHAGSGGDVADGSDAADSGNVSDGAAAEAAAATAAERRQRRCSDEVALRALAPLADHDWLGLETHWDGWVAAACRGEVGGPDGEALPVLFARSSRLWMHMARLATVLGLEAACIPSELCTPMPALSERGGSASSSGSSSGGGSRGGTGGGGAAGGGGKNAEIVGKGGNGGDGLTSRETRSRLDRTYGRLRSKQALMGDFAIFRPAAMGSSGSAAKVCQQPQQHGGGVAVVGRRSLQDTHVYW